MIKGGKGGNRTQSGLRFESRTNLRTVFKQVEKYTLREWKIYLGDQPVAEIFTKKRLYSQLLEKYSIRWESIISKQLIPDDALLVYGTNTLFIVEQKYQNCTGSVDEKLQTCDFKCKQYKKLLAQMGKKVTYVYVLNDWFKDPQYKDVLAYIHSVGCHYFFNEIPLSFFGL